MEQAIKEIPEFFDWNVDLCDGVPDIVPIPKPTLDQLESVEFDDEGPRDGIQGVPKLPTKGHLEEYILLSRSVGIKSITVGVYAEEGSRADKLTKHLLKFMRENCPEVKPIVLIRALASDLEYAVHCAEINPNVEVLIFQASSPIRMWVSGWTAQKVLENLATTIDLAVRVHGLTVLAATEDTTRSTPEFIRKFLRVSVESGASRVVLADTVGHLDMWGSYRFVSFVRSQLDLLGQSGKQMGIDFHGHRDRDADGEVAMAAISGGATRIHGVSMGIGERSGNAALETIIYNVERMRRELGAKEEKWNLSVLPQLSMFYSMITNVDIPSHYPLAGGNAFTTAVGIHADAQEKALLKLRSFVTKKNEYPKEITQKIAKMLRTVYTSVDHQEIGRPLSYLIGPLSGESTVRMWLYEQNYAVTLGKSTSVIKKIKEYAKKQNRVLHDDELHKLLAFLKVKRKLSPQR